jgi:DsbC/DsbD-like thiol-disulfide interchange protein
MKSINLRRFTQFLLISIVLSFPATFAATPPPQSAPNIGVSGYLAVDPILRGRSAQAVVVMDIPPGFHVHSNRPLEKFLIATQLQVEAPKGVRVGSVVYPRAMLRNLKFSKSKVAVYEGRTTMRFNVTVPANFGSDSTEVKARLRYQSCNDEVCFPPQTREVRIPVKIKG